MPSTKHWSSLSVRCLVTLLGMVLFAAPTQAQQFAYVTNSSSSSVSVVDTATNTVTATVGVEDRPIGIAFTPDRSLLYVANSGSNSVSVIDTANNTVSATVAVGSFPQGLAFTPDGSRAYVGSSFSNSVSVIEADQYWHWRCLSDQHRHEYRDCHGRGWAFSRWRRHHPGWISCLRGQ